MTFRTKLLVAAIALCAISASASAATLDTVKARGALLCGVSTGVPGFSLPDSQGKWTGLDVDLCRAVAAAVFGDSTKVRYTGLNPKDRFTTLQSGEIDILSRQTTWTLSRDTSVGMNFAGITYYDGQGFMVRKSLNVRSGKDLNGASICVQTGTTTELNVADYFRKNGLKYEPVTFNGGDEAVKAFESGRCDVFVSDVSGLFAYRLKLPNAQDYLILPDLISKEPLSPAVRHGDDQWFDIVKWAHFAMVNAEELGITSRNVDEQLKSPNPEIKRFLG